MFPLAKPTKVPIPKLPIFRGQETNSEKNICVQKRYKGHTHPKLHDHTFAAYLFWNLYTVFVPPKNSDVSACDSMRLNFQMSFTPQKSNIDTPKWQIV